MKKILLFRVSTFLFVVINIIKAEVTFYVNLKLPSIASTMLGIILLFIYVVYIITSIILLISLFHKSKIKFIILSVFFIITIVAVFVFPLTNSYLNLNYKINKDTRDKTIEMINDGKVTYRVDTNEYIAPFKQTSYSKTIIIQNNNDVLKVLFSVYRGTFIESVIAYTSDDSGIEIGDFSSDLPPGMQYVFKDVEKLSDNWYSAKIEH